MTDDPLDILILEDNEDTARFLKIVLQGVCLLNIELAGNLSEARAAVARCVPRHCLIDLGLPAGEDGMDFLREMKRDHPGVNAVVSTASGSEATMREAIDAGADHYLVKPLDAVTVMKVLGIDGPGAAG